MSLALAACAATLFGCGTYLLLQRTLTRVILGLALLGHGTVLLLQVAGGRAGAPPIMGPDVTADAVVDPLPHALALTAIVISFGVTAFLLALAYRSWSLTEDDEVRDDVEDLLVARRVEAELSRSEAASARERRDIRGEALSWPETRTDTKPGADTDPRDDQ
ncbi:MAG: Na(+)/H(+) antiporter subunit C [Acidimicrobiales bacterium]